jgi:hypothetical protein
MKPSPPVHLYKRLHPSWHWPSRNAWYRQWRVVQQVAIAFLAMLLLALVLEPVNAQAQNGGSSGSGGGASQTSAGGAPPAGDGRAAGVLERLTHNAERLWEGWDRWALWELWEKGRDWLEATAEKIPGTQAYARVRAAQRAAASSAPSEPGEVEADKGAEAPRP